MPNGITEVYIPMTSGSTYQRANKQSSKKRDAKGGSKTFNDYVPDDVMAATLSGQLNWIVSTLQSSSTLAIILLLSGMASIAIPGIGIIGKSIVIVCLFSGMVMFIFLAYLYRRFHRCVRSHEPTAAKTAKLVKFMRLYEFLHFRVFPLIYLTVVVSLLVLCFAFVIER